MPFKTLTLVYFSPTGTSRRVAQNIAAGVDLPVREIDLTSVPARAEAHRFTRDDLVVLALPVYGGRLPRVSAGFFAGLAAPGTFTALAVVYGNRHYDDALLELKNTAIEKGFFPVAAGAFIGEHSFSRKVAANRPDEADAPVQAAFGERFLAKALALRAQITPIPELCVPGKFPYEKTVSNLQITPVVNDRCVNCQTCVDGCPMGAIDRQDPHIIDGTKCISCCYCVKVCPNDARHMEDPRILALVNRIETHFMARRETETYF